MVLEGEILVSHRPGSDLGNVRDMNRHLYDPQVLEMFDEIEGDFALAFPHPFCRLESPNCRVLNQSAGFAIFDEKLNLRDEYREFFKKHVPAIEKFNLTSLLFSIFPVLNRPWMEAVEKAGTVCRKYGLPALGNTDAHFPEMPFDIAYTVMGDGDPIKLIKEGRTEAVFHIGGLLYHPDVFLRQFIYDLKGGELKRFPEIVLGGIRI